MRNHYQHRVAFFDLDCFKFVLIIKSSVSIEKIKSNTSIRRQTRTYFLDTHKQQRTFYSQAEKITDLDLLGRVGEENGGVCIASGHLGLGSLEGGEEGGMQEGGLEVAQPGRHVTGHPAQQKYHYLGLQYYRMN